MPKQKRARGRPKKNWMEEIKKTMNERNLINANGKIGSNGVQVSDNVEKRFEPDIYIRGVTDK